MGLTSRAVPVGQSTPAGPLPTLLGRPSAQPRGGCGAAKDPNTAAMFPPTLEGTTPCWISHAVRVGQPAPGGPLPTLLGRPTAQPGSGCGTAKGFGSAAEARPAIVADRARASRHRPPPEAATEAERDAWTMRPQRN